MENYINTVTFEEDKPVSSLDQKTLSEVKTDSRFEERLEKYCWRQIDGKDHNRLRHVFKKSFRIEFYGPSPRLEMSKILYLEYNRYSQIRHFLGKF